MNRIDRPRFDIHGNVTATFWPRQFNCWNCRQGQLFVRKKRGLRRRSRACLQSEREYRNAMRARLTPTEIDFLAEAVMSKMVSRREIIALDRQRTPCEFMFEGIPIYMDEMT